MTNSESLDLPDLRKVKGSQDHAKLINFAENSYSSCRKYRLQFEQQWYVNLAFYFGRQYVQWSSTSAAGAVNRLIEPQVPSWRVRLITNKIRGYIRKELAKVTKENPMGFVVPQSSDDKDLLAARAGDGFSEWFYRTKNVKKELRKSMFWTLLCGTGFMKVWYDPSIDVGIDPDTGQPILGDMCLERTSPWHIYVPNVQEEELEVQPYMIHAMTKERSWVQATFGVDVEPDAAGAAGVLEDKLLQALGIRESSTKQQVYVKEMWVKPCKDYPEGMVIHWAGEQILRVEEGWPYAHKQYPFVKFDHIPTGRFYGDSTINDLIPLQKEYNRGRSQIIEAKNRMAKPQLIAAKGSIDSNKITSEPGLIIYYTPGLPEPKPLPLSPLPNYVLEDIQRISTDMADIASQHEVTRGQAPPGVSAASAISYLQEEDDSVLSTTIASVEEGVEKLIRQALYMVTQFWDVPRQIQVAGYNNQLEVMALDKEILKGNTSYTVQAGSATPRSLAAKQAYLMELGKLGWIPADRILRYLEMPESSRMYEEMMIDARQQQRENLLMSKGVEVPVNNWDNDEIHLVEVDNYRKRQEFSMLPDEIKAIYESHAQGHKVNVLVHRGIPLPVIEMALQNPIQLEALMAGQIIANTGMQPGGNVSALGSAGRSAPQQEAQGQPSQQMGQGGE